MYFRKKIEKASRQPKITTATAAPAPMLDTAGLSTTESAHYQRARSQNRIFLDGPPDKLKRVHKEIAGKLDTIEDDAEMIQTNIAITSPDDAAQAMEKLMAQAEEIQAEWQQHLDLYMPDHRPWEDNMEIARIHAKIHAQALAGESVARLPEWWVEAFEQHATLEWQLGFPEQQPQPGPQDAGTVPPAQ